MRPPETIELALEGEVVRVAVRRHPSARRLTLRVRAATRDVALTAPPQVSLATADAFVQRHRGWVQARLVRLPENVPFADGSVVPLRGEPHRIVHQPGARGTCWVERDADGVGLICVAGDQPHLARRVRDFLKRQARADLLEAVRRHAAALKVEVGPVTLRDTSSRWGSCAADGALSFSWRLIFAPPSVLDYLAAHEVAHRLEMNHGPRYWRNVERIFPARRTAEAWLRANGAGLHRFGAE
ncbi:M48 family metallopeptidase [Aquabacter cavernae]|uniref:M48 family metallopeptidase n=1 Tax=Aquabacter cavernae TaxID=2496029 RepID=UPI001FDEE969|nr:SprT family zinc-dependent metalloprotease [Aquabacter cavernae]